MPVPVEARRQRRTTSDQGHHRQDRGEDLEEPEDRLDHGTLGRVQAHVWGAVPFGPVLWALVARW